MSSLLDQQEIDRLIGVAGDRTDMIREQFRHLLYAKGPQSTPPGHVNLDSPEKVDLFARFVSRQSEREKAGTVIGNLNQTVASHPAVQDMVDTLPPGIEPEVL